MQILDRYIAKLFLTNVIAILVALVCFVVAVDVVVNLDALMGAGRTELLESIFGLHPARTTGTVAIDGETVMVAPADGFYLSDGAGLDEVRIAYVLDRDRLGRAMSILHEALKRYPGTRR